jgi:alkylation response protein AidB-like acyl-CoA dehydrogenase
VIDLLPSEEQQQIIDSVAGFLAARLPLSRLRPGSSGERPGDPGISAGLWRDMAGLGWFGLGIPEERGGAGLTVIAEMLLARELGRYAISPSIAATIATSHLAARGDRDLLAKLMAGEQRVAVASRLHAGSDEYHLIDPHDAGCCLVADGAEVRLYLTDAFEEVRVVDSLDGAIVLERARLAPHVRPLLRDAGGNVGHRVSLLNSAQLLGVAEAALQESVNYGKAREQFGQAIGSFQAIKHRCADMALRAEAAYAQVFFAGLSQAGDRPDAVYQIAAARVISAEAALANSRSSIQVHGGMGFTAECDAHVFLKRAHLLGQLGGDRCWARAALLSRKTPVA